MIVCKPKSSTLFALGTFLLLGYGVFLFLVVSFFQHPQRSVFLFLLLPITFVIVLLLTVRMLFGYRTISAEKGKIVVEQKLLRRVQRFDLQNLEEVDETVIKTLNGEYKRLNLRFSSGVVSISKQEYESYEKMKGYITQKRPIRKR